MSRSKTRLHKFIAYYKPYRGLFAADIAAAVIVSAVSLILPLYIRHVTGNVLSAPEQIGRDTITAAALIMLGLIILQTGCSLFYDYMGHVMGARMERDMRNDLFAHYQTLKFSFYDQEKTGSVISRITNDLLSIAELCHHGPEDIIIYVFTFMGAFIILFFINLPMALGICVFLPLMFIFAFCYSTRLRRAYTKNREQLAELNARIEDSIAGIRTVKAFGNEDREAAGFQKVNEKFYQSRSAIYKHEAWYYTGLSTFFIQLIMAVTVLFGAWQLSHAVLETADIISFLLYAGYLTAPIPQIARISAMYQEGFSGFNRFMEIMEIPGEEYQREASRRISPVRGQVEFSRVCFKYKGSASFVLKDISFTVKAGEYIALTGPSGIGKTTLCSLIPRFYETVSGAIFIDGVTIRTLSLPVLRGYIGIVPQDIYVFTGTIRENIAYGRPGASEEEIVNAARKANAHDFIMTLPGAYGAPIGPRGLTLSGGQRQRLCIARVFLKDPPILILDEATSALDDESEQLIQESLKNLSGDRTSFVIAHRRSTIQNADRILIFDGQDLREGSREALIEPIAKLS